MAKKENRQRQSKKKRKKKGLKDKVITLIMKGRG